MHPDQQGTVGEHIQSQMKEILGAKGAGRCQVVKVVLMNDLVVFVVQKSKIKPIPKPEPTIVGGENIIGTGRDTR